MPHNLQNYKLYFETSLIKSDKSQWSFLIKDNEEKKYFVEEGVVEFSNNNLLILTSTAKSIVNLKNSFIDETINKSEEGINKEGISDKDRYLLSYKIEVLKNLR